MGFFVLRSSASVGGGGGGSEWQGLTPTHYVTTGASGSGDGSIGNPWTLTQAMANASAGNIVGIFEGVYTHSTGGSPYSSNTPAWHPANSGTAGNLITFVGRYDPTSMGNALTDGNRTELAAGSGAYNGSDSHPVIGANSRNYIRWMNIVVNESNCVTKSDNGPVYTASSTGVVFERLVIAGNAAADIWPEGADNHNAIRIGEGPVVTTGTVVRGCILCDIYDNAVSANAALIMLYGAVNFVIENNELYNSNSLIYIKGHGNNATVPNSGVVRYNYFHDGLFVRVQITDHESPFVEIYQNIFKSLTNSSILLNQVVDNIRIYNNTFILDVSMDNAGLFINAGAASDTGIELTDNIFYATTNSAEFVSAGLLTAAWGDLSNNQYFNTVGYTNAWGYNGTGYSTFASWDDIETTAVNADPGFVNFAAGNYRLNTPNGRGAYITGSETIGAR